MKKRPHVSTTITAKFACGRAITRDGKTIEVFTVVTGPKKRKPKIKVLQ